MTPTNFEVALLKGSVGEAIVRTYLEARGWVVYQPMTEGAHCFDMLSIKGKRNAIALDIKAKARLNKFPATGVNERHFQEYKAFSEKHSMPFWIVFVDEGMRKIYGNTLEELEKPKFEDGRNYPLLPNWKVPTRLWPLSAMKLIADLNDEEVYRLSQHNQRNYSYQPSHKDTWAGAAQ